MRQVQLSQLDTEVTRIISSTGEEVNLPHFMSAVDHPEDLSSATVVFSKLKIYLELPAKIYLQILI